MRREEREWNRDCSTTGAGKNARMAPAQLDPDHGLQMLQVEFKVSHSLAKSLLGFISISSHILLERNMHFKVQ